MAASPQLQAIIDSLIPDPDAPVEAPTPEGINQLMEEQIYARHPVDGATSVPVVANGVPCEWSVHEDADPNKRMAYVHGGGYVAGSMRTQFSCPSTFANRRYR